MIRGLLRIGFIVVLVFVFLHFIWRLLGLAVTVLVIAAVVALLVFVLKRLLFRGRSEHVEDADEAPFVQKSRSKLARIEARIEKLETLLLNRFDRTRI